MVSTLALTGNALSSGISKHSFAKISMHKTVTLAKEFLKLYKEKVDVTRH